MKRLPVLLVTVIPEGSDAKRLDLTDRVLHFEYEDCEDKADALKLTVNNYDLSNFDDPVWKKDNLVQVTWGYTDALAPTRTCRIVKVTGFQELSIEAHGMEVALNGRVRSALFENMKRSDAVRKIAMEAGFRSPEVLHIEDTEVVYPAIQQARLTDAQFIRRLAQKEGFEWFIDFDGFHFHRRDVLQRPLRVIEWRDPSGGQQLEVMSINIENDVTAKPGQVTVKSHDPEKRFGLDKKVNNDEDKTRGVLAATVEVKGPEESKSGQEDVVCSVETHDRALKRQAEAKFRKAQQTAVKMSLEMIGDPNLLAKSVVEVRGVGKRLSQRYYVKSVKHTIKDGYKCNVSLISDGSGGHSTKSGVIEGTSAINVGAPTKTKGKQGPPPPRYGLDKGEAAPPAPPALKESKTTDADGEEVATYHDQRHRDPPPMSSPDQDSSSEDDEDEVLVTGDDHLSSSEDDFESADQ